MGDPAPDGRRILVLDDDPAVRETVVAVLTQAGYRVSVPDGAKSRALTASGASERARAGRGR